MLLQRVDNKYYVREKLEVMFKNAHVSNITNRLGLAMGFGLVRLLIIYDTFINLIGNLFFLKFILKQ